MKPNEYMDENKFDISLEEFDQVREEHVFSSDYENKKKKLLRDYRKSHVTFNKINYARVAAALAVLLVGAPIATNAATGGKLGSLLLDRIWGEEGKEKIESHKEVLYDEEKGSSCVVTYPEHEYVAPAEKVKKSIKECTKDFEIEKKIAGAKYTFLSAVRDGKSVTVAYTIEKKGGVDFLEYSQLDNEAKGAWYGPNSTFTAYFKEATGSTYVDLEQSTPEKLYCYDYLLYGTREDAAKNELTFESCEYPCTLQEESDIINGDDKQKADEVEAKKKVTSVKIPLGDVVSADEYTNESGGVVSISPLSMTLDLSKGLGLSKEEAADPYNAYYVAVQYKDGTTYVVEDRNCEGVHEPKVEVDNTSYVCGGSFDEDGYYDYNMIFNRLVDLDQVESIQVNETVYK